MKGFIMQSKSSQNFGNIMVEFSGKNYIDAYNMPKIKTKTQLINHLIEKINELSMTLNEFDELIFDIRNPQIFANSKSSAKIYQNKPESLAQYGRG